MNMEESLAKCFEGIVRFNSLAGNLDPSDVQRLPAQAKVVLEEAGELFFAVEHEGEDQILKECCDLLVASLGMLATLNVRGYNVLGALNEVINPNNMTKFCLSNTEAQYTAMGYNATEDCGAEVRRLDEYHWGVFNAQGKLLKPIGHNRVTTEQLKSHLPRPEENKHED